jgi:hypothetical protein
MSLFGFLRQNRKPSNSGEQALLVYLDGTGLPEEVYRDHDLETLESLLFPALAATEAGELDGSETGPNETCLFFYGPDAERLFLAIEPVLNAYPLCAGARVVVRQGKLGATQREFRLPGISRV